MIDNYYSLESDLDPATPDQVSFDLEKAEFHNCIIYGSNQIELRINKSDDATLNNWTPPLFNQVLIKFNNTNNDFTTHEDYLFLNDAANIKKNQSPDFEDINRNKLRIGENSAAIDFGDPDISQLVPVDLAGQPRTTLPAIPDVGAYESTIFDE